MGAQQNKRTLYNHATIVPMNSSEPVLNGYLIVNGNLIEEVGSGSYTGDLSQFSETVDVDSNVILPGFINTHGHGAMTLLRGYADDLPLMEWLQTRCWPIEDKMTAEDIYWGTQLGIWEMISTGTTTFTDMYFYEEQVAQAVEETGIRAVLSRGMIGFPTKSEITAKEAESFVRERNGLAEGRITAILGPHAPYTCPPDYLKQVVVPMAKELGVPLQIHVSETRFEVEESLKQYGKTPVELLAELGVFEIPTLAAHCVHVNDQDIAILKSYDVHIAHNPQSNLKLGSGIAPLQKLLNAGLTIGLGTDGAASNNDLDMWEEVRLAATLHKGAGEDSVAVHALQALELGTSLGAKALFFNNGLGTLTKGAPADFIIIDYKKPHYYPRHNVVAHLVYSGKAGDVTDVVIDGRPVMRKGELLTLDIERIRYETDKCIQRLFC